jgi:hypothetical protein
MIQMANELYQQSPALSGVAAMMKTQHYTQIVVPHLQQHLQFMAEDKMHQNELQGLNVRLNALQNAFRQIDAVVEQGQEHAAALKAAQQTASTEEQVKMQKAQAEIQIDRMLATSKIHNQAMKTASQIQTAQQKANAKPVLPRQQLAMQTAQGNAMLSPVQPPSGPAPGEEELGEMPFE